jgi:release factor glutamine methyltransferase
VVGHTYKPLLEKYLSRKRMYLHNGFTLSIPPEVFHPGFFFSTKMLMQQLDRFVLTEKTFLELGAGSGLISLAAAKRGAKVTATDINIIAIEQLKKNAEENNIHLNVVHSDLFKQIPPTQFDFIFINPPYYKKDPVTELDHAWFCGSKGEYFKSLFENIGMYMHDGSEVLMVLCDGCDLQMIQRMAYENDIVMNCILESKNLVENNFIFKLVKNSEHIPTSDRFADLYIALRNKEGRIYTDEELKQLPEIKSAHPLASEWAARKASARELFLYLRFLKKPMDILEVGCGNGWLTHKLSTIPRCRATGIDINEPELEQAKRVFGETEMLKFYKADIRKGVLKEQCFDVIVFAASFQYFVDVEEIIDSAAAHLCTGGSIHIIDTFFYRKSQLQLARMRSRKHFEKLGFPEMWGYYFHHSFKELEKYNYKLFFDPNTVYNRIDKKDRMFPWIVIDGKK